MVFYCTILKAKAKLEREGNSGCLQRMCVTEQYEYPPHVVHRVLAGQHKRKKKLRQDLQLIDELHSTKFSELRQFFFFQPTAPKQCAV